MKSTVFALAAALAGEVAAHATFQALWVDGVDFGSQCARLPTSNSPITDVSSNAIRCNTNQGPAAKKCGVKAGGTVTVEMHQVRGRGAEDRGQPKGFREQEADKRPRSKTATAPAARRPSAARTTAPSRCT